MVARKPKVDITGNPQPPIGHQPLPERIRINSTVILKILGKIHETSITGADIQDESESAVIIRPFKSLVIYEDRLRALHKLLVDRFHVNIRTAALSSSRAVGGGSQAARASGGGTRSADERPPEPLTLASLYDNLVYSPTGLVHLQCLMEFIDTTLKARIDHLRSPGCKKVAFSDLWLLFKPGEFVIDQRERQCYRVISVTSAKHQATNPFEQYRNLTRFEDEETPVRVFCVYVDFDGKRIGPVPKLFTITRFEEEKNATDLEVYPIHLSDTADLRQKLIDRGKLFLEVAAIKHMHYTGPTIDARDEVDSQVVVDFEETFTVEEHIKQRWRPDLQRDISMPLILKEKKNTGSCNWLCCVNENIFDDQFADERRNKEFRDSLYPPAWTQSKLPSVTIFPRDLKETTTEENAVTDEELMIMSYRVFGFVLRSRKWAKLDLTYLRPVQTPQLGDENDKEDTTGTGKKKRKKSAFEQLVIPPKHKDMVMSVIAQHFRDKSRDKESGATYSNQVDLVRGKGKGLILLLHGAPGVGKTSTAECVAELFQKPLFQITCGDLGTTAAAVDATLERNFALANKWDCILLLDEADVFLARRNTKDYVRNGLVAVFLRILEYYAGVLFLTTNRIGDFDEAFTSRVHISLHYPALDEQGTWQVFKINLERMSERFAERGRTLDVDTAEIAVFANKYFLQNPNARWNGRQIRNACSTALALAEYEAQGSKHDAVVRPDAVITLNQSHFETVAESYLKFIEYVRRIFSTYPDDKASEDKLRA
ncbi:P-loop containing nucleoside triphosphate hydrolase protein, partial [Cercophora scortea]